VKPCAVQGRICVWEVTKYKTDQPNLGAVVSPDVSFDAHSGAHPALQPLSTPLSAVTLTVAHNNTGTVYSLTFAENGLLISGGPTTRFLPPSPPTLTLKNLAGDDNIKVWQWADLEKDSLAPHSSLSS
jgi:hypothetical protein